MKKITYIAFAALAFLVSCQKAEVTNDAAKTPLVFTAGIEGTKTTINIEGSIAKIKWEANDEITITDNGGVSAIYVVSTGVGETSATFVAKPEQPALGEGPYTATYGTAPSTANAQTYSDSATPSVPVYMTAASASTDLSFAVQCGVLKFNLTNASNSVRRIVVSDGINNYTLDCPTPVDISSAKDFFIAVPAGTYTSLSVFDGDMMKVATKSPTLVVAANHVKPASSANLSFEPMYVEIGGKKWAKFNLGAISPEQYGYYYSWGNTDGHWLNGVSDGYSFSAANYALTEGSHLTGDIIANSGRDAARENWGGTWRMPTLEEYNTLFDSCNSTWTTQNEVQGRLFTLKTDAEVKIFFPGAGFVLDSESSGAGTKGDYWTSTYYSTKDKYADQFAYHLKIDNSEAKVYANYFHFGFTIRPVSD